MFFLGFGTAVVLMLLPTIRAGYVGWRDWQFEQRYWENQWRREQEQRQQQKP